MKFADVIIVGSGHGGAQAAIALRQLGFEGSIIMVSRDKHPPYERPPLSKDYLARAKAFERLLIRPAQFWADKAIELRLSTEVTRVDWSTHEIVVEGGETLRYGALVWAAGGSPRRLSCEGATLNGVHSVRDRVDVDRMIAQLEAGARRVVVIGGGYIGLEAAAVLNKLDCQVTLLEALPHVLARVSGAALSRFIEDEHRAQGVDLRTETNVLAIEGASGRVRAVQLSSGESIACDMVVVGIGIEPSVGPLLAAGAQGDNGVMVDANCLTSLPGIYAIGDCASHANAFADGARLRLESVQNANDMAKTVAQHLVGAPQPYHAVPWFWSNQYDLKLQTIGLTRGYDETVLRGDPQTRSFSIIYLKEGAVIALDCVNAVKDYVQGKALVAARARVAPALLSDPQLALKDIALAGTIS